VPQVLQGLDQQPLGPLDRDRGNRAVPAQPPRQASQASQASDIMVIPCLVHNLALRIDKAQLMKRITPVDPGEQPVRRSRPDLRRNFQPAIPSRTRHRTAGRAGTS
jgi:hypothetical protein